MTWTKTWCDDDSSDASELSSHGSMHRFAQNQGKQVLRISHIKFHFSIIEFVVIPHGQRDLSSLPWTGEAVFSIDRLEAARENDTKEYG